MKEQGIVLAVGAHPDDVEFNMAGTLCLLVKAGFQAHIFTVSKSDLDSNVLPADEISRIRMKEAERSAAIIGVKHHPGIVRDCMIFYKDDLLRRVTALVREIAPTIILLPSLNDYMEDHMTTARLLVTACFIRGMRNYVTDPPREPISQDVFLYHAQPHLNRDGMRNLVVPELFVDISSEMTTKERMLLCFESQKEWLSETQGLNDIVATMQNACAEVAKMSGLREVKYVEGWRQHNHVGYSRQDLDPLSHILGSKAHKN